MSDLINMYNKTIISFLILCITPLFAVADKKLVSNAIEVRAAKVQIADLYDIFYVVGQCKDDNSRDYYANVTGKLELVSLQQGDKVNKGEVLFVIDKNIAEATKSNAEASLSTEQDNYNRNKALFVKKFISAEVLAKSKSDFENAKFNYSKALKTYKDMVITAPFSGKIGVIKPRLGDDIKQGDYLFSIVDGEGAQSIFIQLPQSLDGKISTNTDVIIKDSRNVQIRSKIASVSGYLSDKGTIDAKIILLGNKKIMHNSYVDVTLILNMHRNLAVPEQSIQRNNKGNFVYKIDANIVKQIYVEIGSRTNGLIEIISKDIHEGEQVVVEGATKIHDRSEVKLLEGE
jgi:RND family efflux transporter MFP subunit